eukprot:2919274-Alexandrium_andersonii.AAC.1
MCIRDSVNDNPAPSFVVGIEAIGDGQGVGALGQCQVVAGNGEGTDRCAVQDLEGAGVVARRRLEILLG